MMATHVNILQKVIWKPEIVYFLFVAVTATALPVAFVATASTGFSATGGSLLVICSAAATSPT
jgi:hypothetical protein